MPPFSPRRELLVLSEAEERLRPFARRYVGVRSIPLRQIVGTDGRSGDFDRDFRPLRSALAPRLRGVGGAFADGAFPPIVASRLGDAYFVVDGHHRVSIARRRGMETIDAEVTELTARWHLSADPDPVELVHAEQHRLFMAESGLADAVPGASFGFTRPVGYVELLEHVHRHGYRVMRERRALLTPAQVAGDWYEHAYVPALETFRREGLQAKWTVDDLFLCVHQRRLELLPAHSGATLADATRDIMRTDAARRGWSQSRRLLKKRASAASLQGSSRGRNRRQPVP
jgi:hypothetical protein